MSSWRASGFALALASLIGMGASVSAAPTPGPTSQPTARLASKTTILNALTSRSTDEIDAILDALAMGLPQTDAVNALDSLAANPDPRALSILLRYAHHRDPIVRAHAIAALGPLGREDGSRARVALEIALGDLDRDVRTAAARACGAVHDLAAAPRLLLLLAKHDEAAAPAVAAIANVDVARRVAELAGDKPDRLVARCLGAMLLRGDLGPESIYNDIVRTLGRMPGHEPLDALADFVKTSGHDAARKLARAEIARRESGEAAPAP